MKTFVSFVCGGIFALGLWVGGMTDPSKVLGFLDVTRDWDPSLAFVMIGAIGVFSPAFWFIRPRRPVFDEQFHPPAKKRVDARLVVGSVLFGIGWGLSGICPGPAVVNVGSGDATYVAFALTMATVLMLARWRSSHSDAADARWRSSHSDAADERTELA